MKTSNPISLPQIGEFPVRPHLSRQRGKRPIQTIAVNWNDPELMAEIERRTKNNPKEK